MIHDRIIIKGFALPSSTQEPQHKHLWTPKTDQYFIYNVANSLGPVLYYPNPSRSHPVVLGPKMDYDGTLSSWPLSCLYMEFENTNCVVALIAENYIDQSIDPWEPIDLWKFIDREEDLRENLASLKAIEKAHLQEHRQAHLQAHLQALQALPPQFTSRAVSSEDIARDHRIPIDEDPYKRYLSTLQNRPEDPVWGMSKTSTLLHRCTPGSRANIKQNLGIRIIGSRQLSNRQSCV